MTLAAEVHANAGPLELLGGIAARLDTMNKSMEKLLKQREEAFEREGPLAVPLTTAPSTTAANVTGSVVMDLGGPSPDRIWLVRRLVVGSTTFATAAAGSASVFISPANPTTPGQSGGALWALVDRYATLPAVAFYSNEQLMLEPGDHLWVEIVSPGAAVNYTTGGMALSLPRRIAKLNV